MCTTSEIPQLFHTNHSNIFDIKEESEGYDTITFEDYKITENYSNQIIKEEPADYYEIVELTNVIDIHPTVRTYDSRISDDENWRKKLYNEDKKFIVESVKNLSDSEKLIESKLKDYEPETFINKALIPEKLISFSEDTKCLSEVNSKLENNHKSEQEELSAVNSQTFSIKDRKCFLVHDHSYSASSKALRYDNSTTDDDEESSQKDEEMKVLKSIHSTRLKKVRHSALKFDERFNNLELNRNMSKLKCDKGSTNKTNSKIVNNTSILINDARKSSKFNSESSESSDYSNSKSDESMEEDEDGIQYKELSPLKLNKALLQSRTLSDNSEDDHSCYTKNYELHKKNATIEMKQQSANTSRVRCDIRINNAMDLKKCFENSSVASTNSSRSIKSCSKKTLESRNRDSCSSNSSHNLSLSSNNQQIRPKALQASPSHLTKPQKSNLVELLTDSSDSDSEFQEQPKKIKKLAQNESKTTTSQSNLQLTCPECPMIFHDTLRLNRHKKTHQGPQFECRNCLRKFKRKSMLKKHFCDIKCSICPDICTCRMEDSKDCMICQKINFRYFVDFKKHKMTHHNEIIYCKICEKNNYTLFRHKQYGHKHEVVKTFKCTECTSIFKTTEQLEYHMEIHAKNFPCSICSKIFTRRYLLKQHELTHKNPKQFYCEICEKSFQRKFCLDNHRKNIHGDKEKEESYLRKHRGMYGEKSLGWISCEQCPALFRNKKSHQRHLSQVH